MVHSRAPDTPHGPARFRHPTDPILHVIFSDLQNSPICASPRPMAGAPKGHKKTSSRHLALKSTIIDNEKLDGTALYKTVAELSTEYEVPITTIYQLRHRLGLKSTGFQKRHTQAPTTHTLLPASTTTEGLLKILEDEPLLTPSDRLRILSRLIRTGAPAVKIAAIKTYEDLTRVTTENVGPPPPQTSEEAVARLARLFIALGKRITKQAYTTAFGDLDEITGPETPIQPDPSATSADAPPPAESLPDLQPPNDPPLSGPLPPDGPSEGPPLQ